MEFLPVICNREIFALMKSIVSAGYNLSVQVSPTIGNVYGNCWEGTLLVDSWIEAHLKGFTTLIDYS